MTLVTTRRVVGSAGSRLGCRCSEGFVGDDCSLNQQVPPHLEDVDDDDGYVNEQFLLSTTMMMMQKRAWKLWSL